MDGCGEYGRRSLGAVLRQITSTLMLQLFRLIEALVIVHNKLISTAWYCKCRAQSDARHNLVVLALTFGSIVNKSWTTAPML
jgi:hypothetical protein